MFIRRHGGVCGDYAVATLMLIVGLGNEPAVLELVPIGRGHGAAGLLTSLVDCGLTTYKGDIDLKHPLPVCTRGYVNFVDTMGNPTSVYKRPVFQPPFGLPDAVDYWFFWRGFVDRLPWWLMSPYAANTTVGREGIRFAMRVAANYSCAPRIAWHTLYPLAVGDVAKLDAGLARTYAKYVNAAPTGERMEPPEPIVYKALEPAPPRVKLRYEEAAAPTVPGPIFLLDHFVSKMYQCPVEWRTWPPEYK